MELRSQSIRSGPGNEYEV